MSKHNPFLFDAQELVILAIKSWIPSLLDLSIIMEAIGLSLVSFGLLLLLWATARSRDWKWVHQLIHFMLASILIGVATAFSYQFQATYGTLFGLLSSLVTGLAAGFLAVAASAVSQALEHLKQPHLMGIGITFAGSGILTLIIVIASQLSGKMVP